MLDFELVRWKRRIFDGGLLLAVLQSIAVMTLFPKFFYYIWPTLQGLFSSPMHFMAIGTFIAHSTQVLLMNGIYSLIYWLHLSFFEQYKVSPKVWPWLNPNPEVRAEFWATVKRGARTVFLNNVLIGFPSLYLTYAQTRDRGAFDTSLEGFPDVFTLVWQLAVCLLVEDTVFYASHWFLHRKFIYKYIHKQHHQFYHSIVLASENAHPIEFLIGNLIPVALGPILVRAHVFTFWMFVWIRIMESTDTHSGYEFPWTIARVLPFSGSTAAHNYHHSHNRGCYGSQFCFWDRIFKTDEDFIKYQTDLDNLRLAGKLSHEEVDDADPDNDGADKKTK